MEIKTIFDNNTVLLNNHFISKLDNMSSDIKMYLNMNYNLGLSANADFKFINTEELDEILEIRKRIKQISYKLKTKLNA